MIMFSTCRRLTSTKNFRIFKGRSSGKHQQWSIPSSLVPSSYSTTSRNTLLLLRPHRQNCNGNVSRKFTWTSNQRQCIITTLSRNSSSSSAYLSSISSVDPERTSQQENDTKEILNNNNHDDNTYHDEEATERKKEIMKYFQNAVWNNIERTLEHLSDNNDDANATSLNNNNNHLPKGRNPHRNSLRSRMNRKYHWEQKQQHEEQRRRRMEKRQSIDGERLNEETDLIQEEELEEEEITTLFDNLDSNETAPTTTTTTTDTASDVFIESDITGDDQSIDSQETTIHDSSELQNTGTTLMDLLDNDYFQDNVSNNSGETTTTTASSTSISKTDTTKRSSTLSSLLSPASLLSTSSNNKGRLIDLLDERKQPGRNLMDLLDDDDDDADAEQVGDNNDNRLFQKESSLPTSDTQIIDWMSADHEGDNSSSSTNGHKKEESLLDLLDDNYGKKSSSVVSNSENIQYSPKKEGNLLDLLDDIYEESKSTAAKNNMFGEKEDKSSSQTDGNLLDLLSDDKFEKSSPPSLGLESSTNDTRNNPETGIVVEESGSIQQKGGLLDLLDNDYGDDSSLSIESTSEEVDTSSIQQKGGLLDLLDDDDGDSPLSIESTDEEIVGTGRNDNGDDYTLERDSSLDDVILRGKILCSLMRSSDWALYSNLSSLSDDDDEEGEEEELDEEEKKNEIEGNTTQSKEDPALDLIYELLKGTDLNVWNLSSDEFNILLHYIASSNCEDKVETMLGIYLHMKELAKAGIDISAPNSDTFSILLRFLYNSGNMTAVASKLCNNMVTYLEKSSAGNNGDFSSFVLEEDALYIGMRVLESQLDMLTAEKLFDIAHDHGVTINPGVFLSLINMCKAEDKKELALDMIGKCIQEHGKTYRRGVDRVLFSAVNWPRKTRDGRATSVTTYYEALIELLENPKNSFVPSFAVLKKISISLSRAAENDSSQNWGLIHRCCRAIVNHCSQGDIDSVVLKLGLKSAKLFQDADLATDLIYWSERSLGTRSSQKLPPSLYVDTIQLCTSAGKNDLAHDILSKCDENHSFADTTRTELYTLVLKGYAQAGDIERTESMFNEMRESGLKHSEQTYSGYLHALALNKEHGRARELLDSMMSDTHGDGIKPGPTSFAACMLSAIQTGAWEDVLQLNDQMMKVGIKPSTTSLHATMIACSQMGNSAGVLDAINSAITSETPMNQQTFVTCVKILNPDIFNENDIERIRLKLRKMAEKSQPRSGGNDGNDVYDKTLSLSRSLKMAVVEDSRPPTMIKSNLVLKVERDRLWRQALSDAISLTKLVEQNK